MRKTIEICEFVAFTEHLMDNNLVIQNNYYDYDVVSQRYYVTTKKDLLCELDNFTQTCCVS